MKAKKIAYVVGAVVCTILTMGFRTISLPVALAFDALNAMASTTDEIADGLIAKNKNI